MFIFLKLYIFLKTRFGQNLLSVVASLVLIAFCAAFGVSTFNRARDEARHSNQDEANGRAVKQALGSTYTGLVDKIGDEYVGKGTGILSVTPDGPFDKAGLKPNDRIPLNLGLLKILLIRQAGKKIVLPVQRAGHRRFSVTVSVPHFTVPYPERVPFAPPPP